VALAVFTAKMCALNQVLWQTDLRAAGDAIAEVQVFRGFDGLCSVSSSKIMAKLPEIN